MGLSIETDTFSNQDFVLFEQKVRDDLDVLKKLLADPDFGVGQASLGAEVEFYIVDHQHKLLPINMEINALLQDPQLTVELNRFNLEYNLSPQPYCGAPFMAIEQELNTAIKKIDEAATLHRGQVIPIGILPTLTKKDFDDQTMTDIPRYRALSHALCKMRGGPFKIAIDGKEPLELETNDVTLEGASTSFQIHWRVPTSQYADYFNAVQLVTPVVLALSSNSPSLFGHHLWAETRIALFKQSIDSRSSHEQSWRHPPRVFFGNGWVRESAWELFAASAALFPPIIPVIGDENPHACFAAGKTPKLEELRLHQGTTWQWNRAIYDDVDGGHLRIEMRSLPAGPTLIDMSANALFAIGCAMAVLPDIKHLTSVLPFNYAEHNFYRAAKYGMDARLVWPAKTQVHLHEESVLHIAKHLLPKAFHALETTELCHTEIKRLMNVIQGRIEQRICGAKWQRLVTNHLLKSNNREEAFAEMLTRYIQGYRSGKPVCEWSISP
ncbi:glutamate-cysteine ligase family protein [Spartinivicinus poritis]|uniref:Glutamate-cysteine ligase family protein n=1 Tax=Spartinivicinus poritis TaxID=2994640 RepID=A0ABT5U1U8_9GAMM|nr:glutamate-cysteine ligase family protein [Spartinivicinus sp. A2-2]MDE1460340.1 glutamate-cysteine ligase family protein [Spartinivicinus sp. A2-2]